VLGPPGIRFYAGHPLILSGGTCIGTLCIIDRRPRDLDLQHLALLKDFANLAIEELEKGHPPVEGKQSARAGYDDRQCSG
jgi:GAF domain-containing protein